MKIIAGAIATLILALSAAAYASSAAPGLPADEALKQLKDGNARYVAGQSTHPNQGANRRAETVKGGQHPVATIIGCSDSRAPLEVVFDQGVGDIFVIRVAGNVAGPDELGTVEYGVGHLGTNLVLVLGHTACGAVTATAQNAKVHGNIPHLINQIKPAVAKAKAGDPSATGEVLVNKAITANVWQTIENILRKSEETRELVSKGKVMIVGGVYDLHTGQVAWLGSHPDQGKLLAAAPKGHGMMMKAKHAPAKDDSHAAAPAPAKAEAQGGSVLDPLPAKAAPKGAAAHQ